MRGDVDTTHQEHAQ